MCYDDDFGGFDDFDEFNDWDATQCAEGDYNAWEDEQVFRDQVAEAQEFVYDSCDDLGHEYEFDPHCGVNVCVVCDHHEGLARCYCGWSASGGDGRQELEDMGERIDEDY